MNIFALHPDPILSAHDHCDQHLHKMILESAQMVSTVLHSWNFSHSWLYKPAYQNHPCTLWANRTKHNLKWLVLLATELENIRQELGHPYHASTQVIKYAADLLAEEFPGASECFADDPALAMPLHIRVRSDINPYQKYQAYYQWKNRQWTALDKRPMTWKNRPVPSYMILAVTTEPIPS